jgi:hypothetical protein
VSAGGEACRRVGVPPKSASGKGRRAAGRVRLRPNRGFPRFPCPATSSPRGRNVSALSPIPIPRILWFPLCNLRVLCAMLSPVRAVLALRLNSRSLPFGANTPSGSQHEEQKRTSGYPILNTGIKGAFFGGVSNIGVDQERPLHSPVTFRQDEFN